MSFECGSRSIWLLAFRSRVASERVEITAVRAISLSVCDVETVSWFVLDMLVVVVVYFCGDVDGCEFVVLESLMLVL